jgi:hypothetical protein
MSSALRRYACTAHVMQALRGSIILECVSNTKIVIYSNLKFCIRNVLVEHSNLCCELKMFL